MEKIVRHKNKLLVLLMPLIFAVSNLTANAAAWDPTTLDVYGLPNAPIFNIVKNIMKWLLAVVGIVGIIGFAIAGIMYLTAAGNDGQIETAKKAMTYSIIGVIVALSGLVVLYAATSALNGMSF